MALSEIQAQLILKIGEKYEKEDGSFVYGAMTKMKNEMAAEFIELSTQQIKNFFKSRRQRAKKYRKFSPKADDVVQHLPIKMLFGYGSVEKTKQHVVHRFIEAQKEDLEEDFARLQLRKDEIETQTEELEETLAALEKVNQEREILKTQIEDANKHISSLKSAYTDKVAECEALKKNIEEFENQKEKEFDENIQQVLQLNRRLKQKEEDLNASIQEERKRLDVELARKDEDQRVLLKRLHDMEDEFKKELERKARYDPWMDSHGLAQRCQELERELEYSNQWNATLNSKYRKYKETTIELDGKLKYYKEEFERKWNASAMDTVEFWRNKCTQLEYENEDLRRRLQQIKEEKSIALTMYDVVQQAIVIDMTAERIIEEILDDPKLTKDVIRAGLLVKIRFIGHYWFSDKFKDDFTQVGNYRRYIKQWDDNARRFVDFRNGVCHEYHFLQGLQQQNEMEGQVRKYFDLGKNLAEELKPLEDVISDTNSLNALKSNKLLSATQVTNRFKELRLLN